MPASKYCIYAHFQPLYQELMNIPKGRTFPPVKHLVIEQLCGCESYGKLEFTLTEDAIKNFFNCLAECFPNLQTMDVSLFSEPDETDTLWEIVYLEMVKFTPQTFSNLPSHLKGSISFSYGDMDSTIKDVLDVLNVEDADVEIVNNSAKVPTEACKLIKKFDIHDGLTFEYELCLCGETPEGSLIELQQLDPDEEENSGEESENEDAGAD